MIKNKSSLEAEMVNTFNGTNRDFLGSDYFTTMVTLKKILELLDLIRYL